MTDILVVVDMQNDFVDGSLGSQDAMAIVPAVARKIRQRVADGHQIIVTKDTHQADYLKTQEGRKLPVPHCIQNTKGWELTPEVQKALEGVDYLVFEKPTFGSEALISHLKNAQPDSVEFIGLCTDICVVSNAISAKMVLLDAEISVDASCCAGTSPANHQAALSTMASCQIAVVQEV